MKTSEFSAVALPAGRALRKDGGNHLPLENQRWTPMKRAFRASALCSFLLTMIQLGCSSERPPDQLRAAIEAIEKSGGEITYDITKPGRPVEGVYFDGATTIGRIDLAFVDTFPQLRKLRLPDMKISDVDLSQISKLTSWETLD